MDDFLAVVHDWLPILYPICFAFIGWFARSLKAYRKKDSEDHSVLTSLTKQVSEMKTDLDAIKAGNIAEYQESISNAHMTYFVNREKPLTIASRGRINAMSRSLTALDDEDGTYKAMVDDINSLPIYQPPEVHYPEGRD